MDAPASAPRVESLPSPQQLALHLALVPLWGACNPLALAASFALAPSRTAATNVIRWSPESFLPVGAATALLAMTVGYALLRATNSGKASAVRLAWVMVVWVIWARRTHADMGKPAVGS